MGSDEKNLVVVFDDSPTQSLFLQKLLQKRGYETVGVNSNLEVTVYARKSETLAFVVDYNLSIDQIGVNVKTGIKNEDGGGELVIRRLARKRAKQELDYRLILVSTNTTGINGELNDIARASGADAFIKKPGTIDETFEQYCHETTDACLDCALMNFCVPNYDK